MREMGVNEGGLGRGEGRCGRIREGGREEDITEGVGRQRGVATVVK